MQDASQYDEELLGSQRIQFNETSFCAEGSGFYLTIPEQELL
jgi:predicted nucleic acid-binding Zn ribbon protein